MFLFAHVMLRTVLSNERDAAASGGIGENDTVRMMVSGKKQAKNGSATRKAKKARRKKVDELRLDMQEDEQEDGGGRSDSTESSAGGGAVGERQREHPFVVTEPGEVARAKKNGLDYLFHLYEQCRLFLLQVQSMAKLQGQKSPTKVHNYTISHRYVTYVIYTHTRSCYISMHIHMCTYDCSGSAVSYSAQRDY